MTWRWSLHQLNLLARATEDSRSSWLQIQGNLNARVVTFPCEWWVRCSNLLSGVPKMIFWYCYANKHTSLANTFMNALTKTRMCRDVVFMKGSGDVEMNIYLNEGKIFAAGSILPVYKITVGHRSISDHFTKMTAHIATWSVLPSDH